MTATQSVDTSLAAYDDIKPKAPSIRERVLSVITDQNGMGVSRTQIALILGINEITAGSRITELLQAGKIKRKGETVLSTSGKAEHLYVLNPDGVPVDKGTKSVRVPETRMAKVLRQLGVTSGNVNGAFIWSGTPEGHNYWKSVALILEEYETNVN